MRKNQNVHDQFPEHGTIQYDDDDDDDDDDDEKKKPSYKVYILFLCNRSSMAKLYTDLRQWYASILELTGEKWSWVLKNK